MRIAVCDVCGKRPTQDMNLQRVVITICRCNANGEPNNAVPISKVEADICDKHVVRLQDNIDRSLRPLPSWKKSHSEALGEAAQLPLFPEHDPEKQEVQAAVVPSL